jgi:hypothetical protein
MHNMSVKHLFIAIAALALAVVGLTSFGLPWATVLPLAIIALCPLMMMLMMGGHAGASHDQHDADHTPLHR